jgi:site-specific recombinase XerD
MDFPIELLTIEHVIRWKMYQDSLGHSTATIRNNLSRLKNVLKFLRKRGFNVLDEENIDLPKVKEKPYTWLSYDEIQKLLDVIENKRDKAIVACLFSTGCRISELMNIDLVDINGNEVRITGKGGVLGTVYLDDYAKSCLDLYLDERRDSLRPVFVSSQRRRMTNSRVAQLLHEYADKAGLDKNVTPHVLRHSFATDLKLNGADIFDIQQQLRHKRISSTQIYTHISDQQRRAAYKTFHSHK